MTLKQKIQQDTKLALKEKRERELSALRMLFSAVINKEKEKRYKIVDELRSSSRTSSLERVRKNFNSFDFANARLIEEILEET